MSILYTYVSLLMSVQFAIGMAIATLCKQPLSNYNFNKHKQDCTYTMFWLFFLIALLGTILHTQNLNKQIIIIARIKSASIFHTIISFVLSSVNLL